MISEASLGLQGVLYILKQNNGNTDVIKDTVLEIMQTLQYSDIKYVKSIWNILKQLIRRVFNEDDIYQNSRLSGGCRKRKTGICGRCLL